MQQPCPSCGGKGTTITHTCEVCHGSKVEAGHSYLTVVLERGMPDGHQIVFKGECDQQPDTQPGDVIFVVKTQSHPFFLRQGSDLHMKMEISLLESLVGFSTTIKHLDDHDVVIERKGITTPGFVQKISKQGLPVHNWSDDFGNLFIEYSIRFPKSLNDAQKKGIRDILASA